MHNKTFGMHLELMRDPARTFPVIADPDAIRSARVWHCKYRELKPLSALRNLEELVIATFPEDSLECLAGLEQLRYLRILHLPKINNIEPLVRLVRLTSLSLATLPSWDASRKKTVVQSLEPLAAMPSLAHLELFGVCPPDKLLGPLERCRHLKTARIAQYPRAEIDRFFHTTGVADQYMPEPSFS